MRWIIGVDVGRRTRGALQFARWLAEAMGESGRDAVIPVHVLHEEHLRMMLRYHRLDEVIEAERAGVSRQVAEVMQRGDLGVESVLAVTVEQGLEAERARQGATGVIVARAAPAEGGGVFRLGGVARRLLRRLASPVIVVPPDLTQARIGDGLVVTGAHPYTGVRDALDSRPWRSLAAHARQAVLVVPAARRSGTGVRSAGAAAPRKGALVDDRLGSAGRGPARS